MTVGGECSGTAVLGGELMMNAMPDCFAGTGRRQGFNMPHFFKSHHGREKVQHREFCLESNRLTRCLYRGNATE